MTANPKWRYGDAWERYPIQPGEIWGLANGSRLAVHDLFQPLPAWMRADLVFADPPWNLGNLRCFYTKAGRDDYPVSFQGFTDALFRALGEINAQTVYLEIGNQAVEAWAGRLAGRFPHIQRWPVLYYRRYPTNLLRGSMVGPTPIDYTGLDEAHCIKVLAAREEYRTIADPCMGRGLVGLAAYSAGQRFVGTELNPRRLAVLLDRLVKKGAEVIRHA